jgi:O-antigen/teichoic acid export membrane protein
MAKNQIKAGALLSYLQLGLGSVISIIYTPIMLRLLGQSEYGLYNLVASVVGYLGILNFGFSSAYIKYFSAFKTSNDLKSIMKLNGMFVIIFGIIALISLAAGGVLTLYAKEILGSEITEKESSIAQILLLIMTLNIAISFIGIIFTTYITANEKFIVLKLIQIVKVTTTPLLTLPILIAGYGAIGMVIIATIVNLIIEFINAYYCIKKLKIGFSFREFDYKLMKQMSVFSSFIFINLIVNQINWNIDRFIIGRFHGTIAVATYSLAAQLNTYYLSLSTAISSVFIPRVNKMISSNVPPREISSLFARVGRVQFFVLSLIFTSLIFFGKSFIYLWAGDNYSSSYVIALILIIPVTVPLIQNLGIEIQKAKNMHQFRSWTYLFIAILNVLISIPLVKHYQGVGAAIGTAISLIVGNIFIMNWHYHKKVGINIIFFSKQILSIFPSLIIPSFYGLLLYKYLDLNNLLYFTAGAISYILIFCISIWFFALNGYEKNLISNPINNLLKKIRK